MLLSSLFCCVEVHLDLYISERRAVGAVNLSVECLGLEEGGKKPRKLVLDAVSFRSVQVGFLVLNGLL
jgi:hypothetical protein